AGESPVLKTYGITDDQAFEVGLPCGGEIDVFVAPYDAALYERIGERRAVVFTDLAGGTQRLVFEGEDAAGDALIRSARSQVVGLTHDEKFDVPALVGALETDAFYIGALGSRWNQELRRERLLEAGVEESALERIHGPLGLDIGAHTPAETAVSILAEIHASR